MRKTMLLLLLAGAAVPGIASAKPIDRSDEARAERAERHQARQEQQEQQQPQAVEHRSQRAEQSRGDSDRPHLSGNPRPNGGDQAPAAVQIDRGNRGQAIDARRQHFGGHQGGGQEAAIQPAYTGNPSGPAQSWRSRERRPSTHDQGDEQQGQIVEQQGSNGSWRQLDQPAPRVLRNRVPVVSNVPREGTQPPLRTTRQYGSHNQSHRWSGNWRSDHRYNWQDHRRRHRSLFRLSYYYDPFGWGYRPFSIGWRLWPSYYSSNYWINDPWQYRLPYAPAGYRWIRYYDDALLVDTWSGQVVDVIRNFFW
jgi:hypothetical protein